MIDLSGASNLSNNSRVGELLAENMALQQTINTLTLDNTRYSTSCRCSSISHLLSFPCACANHGNHRAQFLAEENSKLKSKCVKYKDKLQERLDQIVSILNSDSVRTDHICY